MNYQDSLVSAASFALDRDMSEELLPLTITNHAALLGGWEADRLGDPAWD